MALQHVNSEDATIHPLPPRAGSDSGATKSPSSSGARSLRLIAEASHEVEVNNALGKLGKGRSLKRLATFPDQVGRPGVIRRPSFSADSSDNQVEQDEEISDLSMLPPPSVSQDGVYEERPKSRSARRSTARQSSVLDMRVPGKSTTDTPFLLPLVPAIVMCAFATYLWFQSGLRLDSYLPLAPVLLGVGVGAIMRMGTRTVDFARVIFAVVVTGFATLWGHAAMVDFGRAGQAGSKLLTWDTLPRVNNPMAIIGQFHDAAERDLAAATLMFLGMIAAGLVSSLTAKRD